MMKAELTAENRPACERCQRDIVVNGSTRTHKNQGGVEIVVVLLHVIGVILRRLSFVHCVEIKPGVVILDRLEVHPEGLLDTIGESQYIGPHAIDPGSLKRTIEGRH